MEVGNARRCAWLASSSGLLATGIVAAAFAISAESSEILVVFGLVSWAKYGALLILLTGILGIATIVLTVLKRNEKPLPIGTLIGLFLAGAGSIGLSTFFIYWDLSVF